MAGVDLVIGPTGVTLGALAELAEDVAWSAALGIDVVTGRHWPARLETDFLLEGLDRLWPAARNGPRLVLRRGIGRHRIEGQFPAVAAFCRSSAHVGFDLRPDEIKQALPVRWREGVDVDDPADTLRHAIDDPGGNHATVGMAQQGNVPQILELE